MRIARFLDHMLDCGRNLLHWQIKPRLTLIAHLNATRRKHAPGADWRGEEHVIVNKPETGIARAHCAYAPLSGVTHFRLSSYQEKSIKITASGFLVLLVTRFALFSGNTHNKTFVSFVSPPGRHNGVGYFSYGFGEGKITGKKFFWKLRWLWLYLVDRTHFMCNCV